MTLTRRDLLFAAGSAPALLQSAPLGVPIGCQTYPVRDALAKDFPGTLKQIAAIGYRRIEMCSPSGYERAGFGPLAGMKAAEMRRIIQDAGLGCESCHYTFRELQESLDDRIAFAKELGLRQMILASFGVRTAAMDDWRRAAGDLNAFAAKIAAAGLQAGFHNHDGEFKEIDGVLIYDELMRRLDPKLVKMQFQVSVVSLGFQAADFFRKYPGRFVSLHLQDWSAAEKKQVAVGEGIVDWRRLFSAAKDGGVKNYFVELNMDQMKSSYKYLHGLNV